MKRSIFRGLAPIVLGALTMSACSDSSSSTTQPTEPAPTVTDTFTGRLNQNGAATFSFETKASGTVTATLKTLEPDSALVIGMSLGNWNGTNSTCTLAVTNDNATQGSTVNGAVSAAATLCVRVYDVGNVVSPVSYTVEVVHP